MGSTSGRERQRQEIAADRRTGRRPATGCCRTSRRDRAKARRGTADAMRRERRGVRDDPQRRPARQSSSATATSSACASLWAHRVAGAGSRAADARASNVGGRLHRARGRRADPRRDCASAPPSSIQPLGLGARRRASDKNTGRSAAPALVFGRAVDQARQVLEAPAPRPTTSRTGQRDRRQIRPQDRLSDVEGLSRAAPRSPRAECLPSVRRRASPSALPRPSAT